MTTMDRIAAAMGCTSEDDDDLVEAVRLLVAERDDAIAARDALAGAVREEREARFRCDAATDDAFGSGDDTDGGDAEDAANDAAEALIVAEARTTALLIGTPIAMVRADVVRDHLAALDAAIAEAEALADADLILEERERQLAAALTAVAEERARCAAVCREVAGFYFAEDVGSVVAHACAEAIERGPVTP